MPRLSTYIGLADHSEKTLADSFRAVAIGHDGEADVSHTCHMLAQRSDQHRTQLAPVIERYGEDESLEEPERLHASASQRCGPVRSGCCATSRTCTCRRLS